MSVDALLDDVDAELAALWGAGLALPGPDRSEALRTLAERTAAAGLEAGTTGLNELATALEAPEGEQGGERRERLVRAHGAAQGLASWARLFRAAWSLEVARERLRPGEGRGATKARVSGFSGVVVPVGLERAGRRLMIHALGVQDGGWFVLTDELVDIDAVEPLRRPATSRLFQDRIVLLDVLSGAIELRDHPIVSGGGRRVVRPAFHTRPALRRRVDPVPDGPALLRCTLHARRAPDGWRFTMDGKDLAVACDDTLAFNLEKLAALDEHALRAVVLPRGEGAALLQADDPLGDPAFPTVDPSAFRWAPRRLLDRDDPVVTALVAAMTGVEAPLPPGPGRIAAIARWWLGEPPEPGPLPPASDPEVAHAWAWRCLASGGTLPADLVEPWTHRPLPSDPSLQEVALRALCIGDTPGRALLEAHLALLRRGIEGGGVLPDPMALWAAGDALARLRGVDPRAAPVALLGLPIERLRLLAVGPLGRWLRAGGPADDEAREALLLVLASGEATRFLTG